MRDKILKYAKKNKLTKSELNEQIWKKFQQLLMANDTKNMDALLSMDLLDGDIFGKKLVELIENLCISANCPKKNIPEELRVHKVVKEEKRNPSQNYNKKQAENLVHYMKTRNIPLYKSYRKYFEKRQQTYLEHGCLDFFKSSMKIIPPSSSLVQKSYNRYKEQQWDDGIRLVHSLTGIKPDEMALEELSDVGSSQQANNSLSDNINKKLKAYFIESEKKDVSPDKQVDVVCHEVIQYLYS
ncbi:MAG: hypothetical protein HQL69_01875 [Magnetococcales bacterium]|nr:hypothetical protein [Magnetococcales bacterium]